MAELIVHNPPKAALKASGYIGSPEGDIELTENNKTYNVSSFASATVKIPEEEKTVTPSTTRQEVTPDNGLLSKVNVLPAPLEERTVTPTIVQQTITPEAPAIGLSKVTVGAVLPPPILIDKQITANGVYNAADDNADGYLQVTVDIQPYFSANGTMYYENMVIPDTVTSIKASAYQACVNMRSLVVSGTVKTINAYAFQNAYITSLTLEHGIETIQSFAFGSHHCALIALPSSIKTIQDYAFSSNTLNQIIDLSAFTDPNNIPTLQGVNTFFINRVSSFITANQEMLTAFETATNWSAYAGKYVIKGATS